MAVQRTISPALAEIAAGRDHLCTSEYGHLIGHAEQTIRKEYSLKGQAYGVRPVKIGNRLLWPVAGIAALLNGAGMEQGSSTKEAFVPGGEG